MGKPQYLAHKIVGEALKIFMSAGYNGENTKQSLAAGNGGSNRKAGTGI